MKILAIETSCDDTGISLLEVKNNTFKVLANELSSQSKMHSPYGGVFPTLAKREHIKNLPLLLEKVLHTSQRRSLTEFQKRPSLAPFDLICVTSGPGLEPALWTGIVFAKELAQKYKVPIVPVNHMEGHILSVFGKSKGEFKITKPKFPVLSLLVSGGHTELVLVRDWGKYEVIGETLDDACGEAFDKVARMMDLPYPGGPEISRLAEGARRHVVLKSLGRSGDDGQRKFLAKNFRAFQNNMPSARTAEQVQQNSAALPSLRGLRHGPNFPVSALPRPMMYSKNFDFSFSGLKTAVLYLIRDLGKLDEKTKMAIALEFENAVVDVLVHKTRKAIEKYKIKTLIIGGGVAQNKHLQKEFKKNLKKIKILFPENSLTGDNSIMIGMAGFLKYLRRGKKGVQASSIKAEGSKKL